MMKVALFSALPHELSKIIKKTGAIKSRKENRFDVFHSRYSSRDITFVLTGIGSHNAEEALKYVLDRYAPEVIVSVGFGGALYEGASIGDVICASRVFYLDEGMTNMLNLGSEGIEKLSKKCAIREGSIVTLKNWKNKAEIRNILPVGLHLPVCDMETFSLARLSLEKKLPFFAIRSITDKNDEDIPPELLDVSDESGRYQLSRAIRLLFSKPGLIPASMRLGLRSRIAGASLWQAVDSLLDVL